MLLLPAQILQQEEGRAVIPPFPTCGWSPADGDANWGSMGKSTCTATRWDTRPQATEGPNSNWLKQVHVTAMGLSLPLGTGGPRAKEVVGILSLSISPLFLSVLSSFSGKLASHGGPQRLRFSSHVTKGASLSSSLSSPWLSLGQARATGPFLKQSLWAGR